jgi:hypothetical protein
VAHPNPAEVVRLDLLDAVSHREAFHKASTLRQHKSVQAPRTAASVDDDPTAVGKTVETGKCVFERELRPRAGVTASQQAGSATRGEVGRLLVVQAF